MAENDNNSACAALESAVELAKKIPTLATNGSLTVRVDGAVATRGSDTTDPVEAEFIGSGLTQPITLENCPTKVSQRS